MIKSIIFLVSFMLFVLVSAGMVMAQGRERRDISRNETYYSLKQNVNGPSGRGLEASDYAREAGSYDDPRYNPQPNSPTYCERERYPMGNGNSVRVFGRVGSVRGASVDVDIEYQRRPRPEQPLRNNRIECERRIVINDLTLYPEVPVTLRVEYTDPNGDPQTLHIDPRQKMAWINIKPGSEPIMFGEYKDDPPFEVVVKEKNQSNGQVIGWTAEQQ